MTRRRLTCQEQLDVFLAEVAGSPCGTGNRWLEDRCLQVYVRATLRFVPEGRGQSLDIANVSIRRPEKLRKGIYRAFLEHVDRVNPYPILYHENVHNDDLAASYERRGFTRVPYVFERCYYKIVKPDALTRYEVRRSSP